MTTVLAVLFVLTMVVFLFIFLIRWILLRGEVRPYLKYGFGAAAAYLIAELTLVLLNADAFAGESALLFLAEVLVFIQVAAYTVVGVYYCVTLGYPSLPLLLKRFGPQPVSASTETPPLDEATPVAVGVASVGEAAAPESQVTGLPAAPDEAQFATERLEAPAPEESQLEGGPRRHVFTLLGVVVGGVLFTVLLFLATSPSLAERAVDLFGAEPPAFGDVMRPQVLLALVAVSFREEVIFRLGIQSFLAKHLRWRGRKYALAVLWATVIWTVGHAGALNPEWVKLVQVFPVGLALGWVFRKYGLGSAVLVHGAFNVIIAFVAGPLLR